MRRSTDNADVRRSICGNRCNLWMDFFVSVFHPCSIRGSLSQPRMEHGLNTDEESNKCHAQQEKTIRRSICENLCNLWMDFVVSVFHPCSIRGSLSQPRMEHGLNTDEESNKCHAQQEKTIRRSICENLCNLWMDFVVSVFHPCSIRGSLSQPRMEHGLNTDEESNKCHAQQEKTIRRSICENLCNLWINFFVSVFHPCSIRG